MVGAPPKAWVNRGPVKQNQTRYWIPMTEVMAVLEFNNLEDAEQAAEPSALPPPPRGPADGKIASPYFPR